MKKNVGETGRIWTTRVIWTTPTITAPDDSRAISDIRVDSRPDFRHPMKSWWPGHILRVSTPNTIKKKDFLEINANGFSSFRVNWSPERRG